MRLRIDCIKCNIERSKVKPQNSKTLLVVYKQQQSTTAMPTVYKNKRRKEPVE